MGRRATLEDVAAHAAVSRQTVSNVINSPDVVRDDTRQRVLDSIDTLGYQPNRAARQLVTRRSHVLGFAVPASDHDGTRYGMASEFLHALTEAAQAKGFRIILFSVGSDTDEITQYAELLDGADLDGFVLANTHHGDPRTRWLSERRVPFVTFGRPWGEKGSAHHWVDVDGARGTRDAVQHLAELGHRRIAFAGWPQGSGVGDDRRAGWTAAMRDLDTADNDLAAWQAATTDSVEAAREPLRELLERVRPTALVCVSDTVAIAALALRRELGLDVAVVGFDDAPVAEPLALTSLRQPLVDAAARCVELVLGDPDAQPQQTLLAPVLIPRRSSATPLDPATTSSTRRNP